MAQCAPSIPKIPSAKTIRRRLQTTVQERHQSILRKLPDHAKISIALDCWTSPFSQAFMAISGYFIDEDWQYEEVLLGFEPLSGTHSGENLSAILLNVLIQHHIQDRVLAITTDNASNNNTLVSSLQQSLSDTTTVIRVPCLAHVIQLSLKELLGQMKADPINDTTEIHWTSERSQQARANASIGVKKQEIAWTLSKVNNSVREVSRTHFSLNSLSANNFYSRFAILQSTLMQALSAAMHSISFRLNQRSLCHYRMLRHDGIRPF